MSLPKSSLLFIILIPIDRVLETAQRGSDLTVWRTNFKRTVELQQPRSALYACCTLIEVRTQLCVNSSLHVQHTTSISLHTHLWTGFWLFVLICTVRFSHFQNIKWPLTPSLNFFLTSFRAQLRAYINLVSTFACITIILLTRF